MKLFRPLPSEERWLTAAARLSLDRSLPWLSARSGSWTTVTMRARCLFFAFSLLAAGFCAWVLSLLGVPYFLLIAGVLSVAIAEWLVGRIRLWQAGIEEGLELAGLGLIALQLITRNGAVHGLHLNVAMTVVFIVVGSRFLNPLLTTMGALTFSFTVHAIGFFFDLGYSAAAELSAIACLAAGWIALALGALTFARPSHEKMLEWLVIAMPIAGYLWTLDGHATSERIDSLHAPQVLRLLAVAMLVAHGIAALIAGLRRRTHAPLAAFIACCGCLAYEWRNLTGLTIEVRLLVAGSALFALGAVLDLYLRTPRRGVTSADVSAETQSEGLLQLFGASALTPHAAGQAEPAFKGGGGAFGGGGASGSY